MNTEYEIVKYGLKTKRQKKRLVKKDFEKKLLAISKERTRLYKLRNSLGWEDLPKPIVRGFKRTFVLREDVARSDKASFFTNILDKINTVQYSHKKEVTVKKRRFGKKYQAPRRQELRELYWCEVQRLKLTNQELIYFNIDERYSIKSKSFYKVLYFNEPWRYQLKVELNIITKRRKMDSEIDRKLAEIDNYLEVNHLDGKLNNLTGRRNKWKDWKFKSYKNEVKKTLLNYLNEL
jgi:hypothetical protein